MTKNRAQKRTTRARMESTGESYLQALRSDAPVEILAWDDEWENVVIYGTHDPAAGMKALHAYWRDDCGFKPGGPEWLPEANHLDFYRDMIHLWTEPKEGDEEPFDRFKEAAAGRVPYMYASL